MFVVCWLIVRVMEGEGREGKDGENADLFCESNECLGQ
jgi:hypothetical protein